MKPVNPSTMALGLFLIAWRISMLSPPSKRITISAKAAKYGVIEMSCSWEKMLSTGPKSNPNKSNKMGSGMLVRLKNSSPKNPKTITSPATRNARTAGSNFKTP